ncbi:DUF6049 family protein [Intrasporangium sp. DVR]|uniref:DUF6049 family protein n=1 Tax=Intrasporangium sp. DVR TaxID=3127867 RepID=UPI00313A51C6
MTSSRPWRAALRTVALTTLLGLVGPLPATGTPAGSPTPDLAASAAATTGPAPAITPDDERALITLTGVSPTVLDGQGETRITGTVTAPTSGPLVGAHVDVVLGSRAMTVRADIDRWVKEDGKADGRTAAQTAKPLPEVPAGRTTAFSIDLEEWQVSTSAAFAALPVAIEVYQRGASTPIGTTRTFLAWNSRVEFAPLQIALAVPVTLDPHVKLFSRDEEVRTEAWAHAIGPGSRVDRLVEGTKDSYATLGIDPSVLVAGPGELAEAVPTSGPTSPATPTPGAGTATTPTSPSGTSPTPTSPTPTSPSGTSPTSGPADGGGPAQSSPDVDRLAAKLRGRSLFALPYADADVAATGDIDPGNSVVRALVARAATVGDRIGEPVRGDIAWPVDGLLPSNRVQALQSLYATSATRRAAGIIVNQAAITADSPYTPTARRISSDGTRLIGSDARLSALLPKRSDPTPVLATQRFLAETLLLLGERPGTARSVLVTAPRNYNPDPAALSAFLRATTESVAWLETVDVEALLADAGSDRATAQEQPATAPRSAAPRPTLSEFRLEQLARQRHTLDAVATVLKDGASFERTYGELLDELASARWRFRPAAWGDLNNSVSADVRDATSAIRVVPRRINFLAENGSLRITVQNGLSYAVEDLRLVVTPMNPRLQVLEQPGPVSIAAGPDARRNINVPVHAVAAGRADILAYLTTADGTRIGSEAVIPVSANPLDSTFYWIGGVLAGLVLLGGVIRALLKGTSRIEEIGDLDTVAQRDEAIQNRTGR